MTVEILGVAKALSKPINDIYESGKDLFKSKLMRSKSNANINRLYKSLSAIHKVKTIWQVDKEVSLKSFYYPPKIILEGIPSNLNSINKFPTEGNIVIQGIVGQGKSIFMRYLCYQEMRSGLRLPIFFELRRIEPKETLKKNLYRILDAYGFDINDNLFSFLCDSGKIVLILDGFDEIKSDQTTSIINELELLSEKHPNLKILVSSRPDSGIERSPLFRVYRISPLTQSDFEGILEKLTASKEKASELYSAINNSNARVKDLIKTPLMMTLLVMVYKTEQKIPEQLSEFYENLFPMLLYRHDKSKPGYTRQRATSVSEKKLQSIFEAFCFISRKYQLSTISNTKIHSISEEAFNATQINCDSTNFISDITKVSNLLIEEGFSYHFIHKSVQEFYSANYIKSRPDEKIIEFYSLLLQGKYHSWPQELNFLSQIDTYRFNKYFMIPIYLDFFKKIGIEGKEWGRISDEKIREILNNYKILVSTKKVENEIKYYDNGIYVAAIKNTYKLIDIQLKIMEKLLLTIDPSENPFRYDALNIVNTHKDLIEKKDNNGKTENFITFMSIFDKTGKTEKAEKIINESLRPIFDEYVEMLNTVEHTDGVSLVDF